MVLHKATLITDRFEIPYAITGSGPCTLICVNGMQLVAAAYAATYPPRVSHLVLGSFQTRANAKLRDVARRGRALVEQGRIDDLTKLFVSEFGNRMSDVRQSAIRTQFQALRPEQVRQMYDQSLLLLTGADLGSMVDLFRISARTLIVNGEADPLLDPYDAVLLVRRLSAATIHIEPGAGHFLHFERPGILEIYARFLTEDDPPAVPDPTLSSAVRPTVVCRGSDAQKSGNEAHT